MRTRSLRSAGLLLIFAVLGTACSSDSPLTPDETVVGTYALVAVGGEELPLTIAQNGDGRLEIIGGSLELTVNGTFREVFNFRNTPTVGEPEDTTDELTGTYSVTGNTVNFSSGGQGWAGTASEGSVSYLIQNVPILFRM